VAVQIYEIRWDGFFTLDEAIRHRIARGNGIYICWEGRRAKYIGKSKELSKRLGTHKGELNRYVKAETEKANHTLGEILNYSGDRVTADITSPQLGNIETFLINKVPNGNPRKNPYKGRDSIIIVNTGKTVSLDNIISHNPATLDLLSKGIKSKKTKQSQPKRDPLFYVGKI